MELDVLRNKIKTQWVATIPHLFLHFAYTKTLKNMFRGRLKLGWFLYIGHTAAATATMHNTSLTCSTNISTDISRSPHPSFDKIWLGRAWNMHLGYINSCTIHHIQPAGKIGMQTGQWLRRAKIQHSCERNLGMKTHQGGPLSACPRIVLVDHIWREDVLTASSLRF